MLMMKCTHMLHARNDVIHVRTLWSRKVPSNVLLKESVCKVRRSISYVSKNVTHIAFFFNCLKQGVRSIDWKPKLQNYKSHIRKKMRSSSIVYHFIDV